MSRICRHSLAWCFSITLLVSGGFLSVQAAQHTLHHVHHSANLHLTGLCAWMCAAAQATAVAPPVAAPDRRAAVVAESPVPQAPSAAALRAFDSRGPPLPV
jgi:hypothetical protein